MGRNCRRREEEGGREQGRVQCTSGQKEGAPPPPLPTADCREKSQCIEVFEWA